MTAKTATERKATQYKALKDKGLSSMLCWVLPENKQAMKDAEMLYREKQPEQKNERF